MGQKWGFSWDVFNPETKIMSNIFLIEGGKKVKGSSTTEVNLFWMSLNREYHVPEDDSVGDCFILCSLNKKDGRGSFISFILTIQVI